MTTREALIEICSKGDNAWRTVESTVRGDIYRLVEAWTNSRKKQVVDKNSSKGFILMSHAVLGSYDLVLWRVACDLDLATHVDTIRGVNSGYFYAVSINSEQFDPTDVKDQLVAYPGSQLGFPGIMSILDLLREWIDVYGKIAIGSGEGKRVNRYRKFLSKYFRVSELDTKNPGAGFFIE